VRRRVQLRVRFLVESSTEEVLAGQVSNMYNHTDNGHRASIVSYFLQKEGSLLSAGLGSLGAPSLGLGTPSRVFVTFLAQ